jgi:hypothetical protein
MIRPNSPLEDLVSASLEMLSEVFKMLRISEIVEGLDKLISKYLKW